MPDLKKILCFLLILIFYRGFLPTADASRLSISHPNIFRMNISGVETTLKKDFPDISFNFSEELDDWYKFLLYETISAIPKKHINNLQAISIKRYEFSRRGVLSFYMNVRSKSPSLSLRFDLAEFPLETDFECSTPMECMQITDPYINREFVAVAVHEIGHAIDFGYSTMGDRSSGKSKTFKNGNFSFYNNDPSVSSFYPICFNTEKRLDRKRCNKNDFVSSYAKIDAFEDFAETMTVYILDGDNFYIKALANQRKGFNPLMKKYKFFKEKIFDGEEFRLSKRSTRNLFSTNDATLRRFSLGMFLYKY